ncbi:MAG: hypothetical protein V2A64_04525 [Candidatus Omnitrophota bacterium]
MNRENRVLIGMFIFLIYAVLYLTYPAAGKDEQQYNQEYEESLKTPGIYNETVNYLRKERKSNRFLKLDLKDMIIFSAADLFISLFCLWITLALLTAATDFAFKKYRWFLFISNLTYLLFLLALKLFWKSLEFLTIRLQPNLELQVIDSFTLFVIIAAALIYIWLLARTFQLNFFGASGTFLISHLLYFLIILGLLFIFRIALKEDNFLNSAKENLGIKLIIQSYLSDIHKITSGCQIWDLIRIKMFHM